MKQRALYKTSKKQKVELRRGRTNLGVVHVKDHIENLKLGTKYCVLLSWMKLP
jgi:hypothetical protein